MNFQDFKNNIDQKFTDKIAFELLEFHFTPYSFGSGLLAYRLKGFNYRIIFDGRENLLTVERSENHEKYSARTNWTTVLTQNNLDTENLEKIFKL